MKSLPPNPARRRQSGVALLEALIGILIFSFGILAVVGMHTVSVKRVSDSKYRVDASFLANELIDEMWVNRGVNNAGLPGYAYDGTGTPGAAVTQWVDKVQSTLPGVETGTMPVITISRDPVTFFTTVTIQVQWRPPGAEGPNTYTATGYINA